MHVKDKVIVVTGGASGIGKELVLLLLKKGAKVAAVDINKVALKELEAIAGEESSRLSYHILDLSDKAAVEKLPEQIITRHGNVEGLINNAGIIQPFIRINDLDYNTINKVFNVNFFGTLFMVKSFLPHFLKQPEAHIVNISSMGGFLPVPGQSIYGAAKAAVKLMTEGLHSELVDTNVRVTVVFPGAVSTNILTNSGINMQDLDISPNQEKFKPLAANIAAEIIIKGMEKNKPRIFVGRDSKIMNFLYSLSPNFATNMITKQMKTLLKD
jgi:short-subunit dehydrogenase